MTTVKPKLDAHFLPVARFAHDLATPLSTLATCVEAIATAPNDQNKIARLIPIMGRTIDFMLLLLKEAGDAATGKHTRSDFRMSSALADALSFVTQWSELPRDAFSMSTINDFTVHGPLVSFQRALVNLMKNADHAVRVVCDKDPDHAGIISWSVDCQDGVGIIKLTDNGTGMSPAQQESFWDDGETDSNTPGRGLGMGIVQSIVCEDMGGSVGVTSKLGQGTTFTITLPRCEIAR